MFEIKDTFYLNGQPLQIRSGSIHYFRVVPEYWRDRLEKLVNMGCNTVETYIPWNFHEPQRGHFVWDGMHDVCRFLSIAQELGLYIILRPSPYICAEWDLGGLPAWLLKEPGMRLRCLYKPYLDAVQAYYNELLPRLLPYLETHGGRVLMVQIENEYGSYGNDKAYLAALRDMLLRGGIDVPLFTSDGPTVPMVTSGTLPGIYAACNFGSRSQEQFRNMGTLLGRDTPKMCAEFWCGWFDYWGNGGHMHSDLAQNKVDLEAMLNEGHFNLYMFHGGTNFGFMSGANYYDKLTPDVTSYDYDSPLAEDGRPTEKYYAFREIIARHADIRTVPLSTDIRYRALGQARLNRSVSLWNTLDKLARPVCASVPLSMEELDQNYGYILYRAALHEDGGIGELKLEGANDRVNAYLNEKPLFTAYDLELPVPKRFEPAAQGDRLDLLVENMGRVNYGSKIENQRKGITGGVQLNGHRHFGFEMYTLPLDAVQLNAIDWEGGCTDDAPTFREYVIDIEEPADTFVDFTGFGKGCLFINGFNLGRFWEIGPQKRLYLPAPLLRKGRNTFIVFETEGKTAGALSLCAEPDLG